MINNPRQSRFINEPGQWWDSSMGCQSTQCSIYQINYLKALMRWYLRVPGSSGERYSFSLLIPFQPIGSRQWLEERSRSIAAVQGSRVMVSRVVYRLLIGGRGETPHSFFINCRSADGACPSGLHRHGTSTATMRAYTSLRHQLMISATLVDWYYWQYNPSLRATAWNPLRLPPTSIPTTMRAI